MPKIIALAALLLLGACQSPSGGAGTVDPAAAAKTVYGLKAAYAGLLTGAVAYVERPRCGQPASPITCSDEAVVVQLRKADAATSASIEAAESAVRSLSQNPTAIETAIRGAQAALSAYRSVTAVYAPK